MGSGKEKRCMEEECLFSRTVQDMQGSLKKDVLKDMERNIGLMDGVIKATGRRIKCKEKESYFPYQVISILEDLKEDFHMDREYEDGLMGIFTKEDIELDIKMELVHLYQWNKGGNTWGSG